MQLRKNKTFTLVLIALGVFAAMLTGCDSNTLQALTQAIVLPTPALQPQVDVNFCTDPASAVQSRLKYLIILDHSGSNQQNYKMNSDGTPIVTDGNILISTAFATDPNGTTRYGDVNTSGTLLNFLANSPANDPTNPTRWFAIVNFNTAIAAYPNNGDQFTSDIPAFYNQVLSQSQTLNDGGGTDYIQALNYAQSMINSDIQHAQICAGLAKGTTSPGAWCPTPGQLVSSSYVIVFMSDGSPILSILGSKISRESSYDILSSVTALASAPAANPLYVDNVNLFTVYYYNSLNTKDSSAQALLAQMAAKGNGVAYDALSNSNIDYTRFTPPAKMVKYTLSDVFVTNSSVVWGKDGQIHLDSDHDGLSDDDEIKLGSDPFNSDSDGNGVSDYVEFLLNGKPCAQVDSNGQCVAGTSHVQIVGTAGNCILYQNNSISLGSCPTGVGQWDVLSNGQIQLAGTQSCLSGQDNIILPTRPMGLVSCTTGPSWTSSAPTNSYGSIRLSNNYCIDALNFGTANGTTIDVYPCVGQQFNQQWRMVPQVAPKACSSLPMNTRILDPRARALSTAIQFNDTDNDGLNDCEEILLNNVAGVNNPISNGNMIPDGLAFKNGLPFQLGATSSVEIPDSDGYTPYQKIKLSLPTLFPITQILNPQPAKYSLSLTSTSTTQDCYNLNVSQFPYIGNNNTIRVDIILKSLQSQGKTLYRAGQKSFTTDNPAFLQFNDWNDPQEQLLQTWKAWP